MYKKRAELNITFLCHAESSAARLQTHDETPTNTGYMRPRKYYEIYGMC